MNSHRTKSCHQIPTTGDRINVVGRVGREGKERQENGAKTTVHSFLFLLNSFANIIQTPLMLGAPCSAKAAVYVMHSRFLFVYTPLSADAEKVGDLGSTVSGGLELERPLQATQGAPSAIPRPV